MASADISSSERGRSASPCMSGRPTRLIKRTTSHCSLRRPTPVLHGKQATHAFSFSRTTDALTSSCSGMPRVNSRLGGRAAGGRSQTPSTSRPSGNQEQKTRGSSSIRDAVFPRVRAETRTRLSFLPSPPPSSANTPVFAEEGGIPGTLSPRLFPAARTHCARDQSTTLSLIHATADPRRISQCVACSDHDPGASICPLQSLLGSLQLTRVQVLDSDRSRRQAPIPSESLYHHRTRRNRRVSTQYMIKSIVCILLSSPSLSKSALLLIHPGSILSPSGVRALDLDPRRERTTPNTGRAPAPPRVAAEPLPVGRASIPFLTQDTDKSSDRASIVTRSKQDAFIDIAGGQSAAPNNEDGTLGSSSTDRQV